MNTKNVIAEIEKLLYSQSNSQSYYIPKYFILPELVSKTLFNKYAPHILWQRLNPIGLKTLDMIREKYDEQVWVNTYTFLSAGNLLNLDYGSLNSMGERGMRSFDSDTGASLSLHKFGSAFDFNLTKTTPAQFHKDLMDNPNDPEFKWITGKEWFDGMGWNHIDFRNHNKELTNGQPAVFDQKGIIQNAKS
jgi:hypothetical protein